MCFKQKRYNGIRKRYVMKVKQLIKQLRTWKKYRSDIYDELMNNAHQYGIVLKNGNISQAKKNSKKVNEFVSKYYSKYGSYTSYMKKEKEKLNKQYSYEEIKEQGGYSKLSQKIRNRNKLIETIFALAPSSEQARNELDYVNASDMTIEEQIDYFNNIIDKLNNNVEWGDWD